MKKTYFNHLGVKHAQKIMTRRFPGTYHNRTAAYKSDGKGGDDERTEEDLLKKIDEIIEARLATRATKEELLSIKNGMADNLKGLDIAQLRAMADDKTGAMALLSKQSLEIARLQQENQAAPKGLSMREQIIKWREANKAALETIAGGTKAEVTPLEIRVASPMTPATVNGASSPYIGRTEQEDGINGFLRFPNTFWDNLVKGRTGSSTYVWVNATNKLGAAAFIGPGIAKPGISFELAAENSVAKKIAVSAKVAMELLQDIDGMETFLTQELYFDLMDKVNTTLMDSVGSNTVPTGMKQLSTTYTLTSIKTTNPNMMDALRAVVAQLRSGKLKGDITIYINSIAAANMDLAKADNSGVYLLPAFVTSDGRTISGAKIVEDNNVPENYFQAAIMRYYRVLIYKDYTVSWGWENDDFTKNLSTAIGEMRLHQFFNTIHTGAFIYDTYENVKTAIEQA